MKQMSLLALTVELRLNNDKSANQPLAEVALIVEKNSILTIPSLKINNLP